MPARTVRDIMAKDVATLDRNDTLSLARDIMKMKRIRHFPVLDDGELVGVLSQRDLFHATLGSVMKYGEKAEGAYLATVAVKEVMSAPPVTAGPAATIGEAARLMVDRKIGCLPVVEQARLVGLVTETDLLRHLAEIA